MPQLHPYHPLVLPSAGTQEAVPIGTCMLQKGIYNLNLIYNLNYSQTCVQRPPLGPEKHGR
jgi:hypothetical protein